MSTDRFRYLSLQLNKGLYEEVFAVATVHAHAGEYLQSLVMYEQLLEKIPDDAAVRYNYAFVLEKSGRYAEALEQYQALILSEPGFGKAAIGCARMLEQGRQYWCAVTVLRRAIVASPDDPHLIAALGNSLIMAGEPEAALLWYDVARAMASDHKVAESNFLYTLLMVRNVSACTIANELQETADCPLLVIHLANAAKRLRHLDADAISSLHMTFGTPLEGQARWRPFSKLASNSGRIRVGYISADLYSHPVGYFLEGVLPYHDRQRWEIFVFSPYAERDRLTAHLKTHADHWIVMNGTDRNGLLQQIRGCELDIAVDLAGHTGGNYLDLFAKGLATTQITWGGYPGTSGLFSMDYIIADHVSLPTQDERFYIERPLRLPHDYICLVPPEDAPLPGPLSWEVTGCITFGSFNSVQKLNSSTIALWGAVLRAIPDSRLFLKSKGFDDPLVCLAFIEKLAEEGVVAGRVCLEGFSSRLEVLAAYHKVDIALDPDPYQGGVTVLEALWMGVPTLVLQGNRPPFIRHGESHLINVGLSDWIAVSNEDYIAKAVTWSRNLSGLAVLRNRLRQLVAASPVCDTLGFTRNLEAAFEQAWHDSL